MSSIERKSNLQALRAVFSAFTGIGKGKKLQDDLGSLRPQQVILTGIVCAAIFVGAVITVVKVLAK
jgi:hypothetical protein